VFRIEPGDLVISNVFAWEGAVALASERERGKIGSHRFMTFVASDPRLHLPWASWFFRSEPGLELIRKASPGSAGRNRTLAIERFEALEIPLPPIDEQRQVAARLDGVVFAVDDLVGRTRRSQELANAFGVSISSREDISDAARAAAEWRLTRLDEVLTPRRDAVVVSAAESYPNVGIYSFGRGLFRKADIEGAATSARSLNRISSGQFIYSRLFAFEGAYASVTPDFDGSFVSNEFPTFDPDPTRLDARWLASYLRSPHHWTALRASSKGLGVRRQRVPVEAVLAYEVWLPPITTQREIVEHLDQIEAVTARRVIADSRINALLPAALNEAFAGLS
jgi:hypothetical protein